MGILSNDPDDIWYKGHELLESDINSKRGLNLLHKAAELGSVYAMDELGEWYSKANSEKAIYWYTQAAEHGFVNSMATLGRIYSENELVQKDIQMAIFWYVKAAENDYKYAARELGEIYSKGKDVPKDEHEAFKWYLIGAELGDSHSQYEVGWYYSKGNIVPKNDKLAEHWYLEAANQGYSSVYFQLGWLYQKSKTVFDFEASEYWYLKEDENCPWSGAKMQLAELYETGAEFGHPEKTIEAFNIYSSLTKDNDEVTQLKAKFKLGMCYEKGIGCNVDYNRAVTLYQSTIEHDSSHIFHEAEYALSQCYRYGRGVKQDEEIAQYWQQKAGEHRFDTGKMWEDSLNDEIKAEITDPKYVYEAYFDSANYGHIKGQYKLGWCYETGCGCDQDLNKAFMWYSKSAEQGCVEAAMALSECYRVGKGVSPNLELSRIWGNKAGLLKNNQNMETENTHFNQATSNDVTHSERGDVPLSNNMNEGIHTDEITNSEKILNSETVETKPFSQILQNEKIESKYMDAGMSDVLSTINCKFLKHEDSNKPESKSEPKSSKQSIHTYVHCPHCNSAVGDNDYFCKKCGTMLVDIDAPDEIWMR